MYRKLKRGNHRICCDNSPFIRVSLFVYVSEDYFLFFLGLPTFLAVFFALSFFSLFSRFLFL